MLHSSLLRFGCFICLCASIAVFQTFLFQAEILQTAQYRQSDFIVDAYYYLHLGEVIADAYIIGPESLFVLVNEFSPTPTSVGIVYINSLYGLIFDSVYAKVLFHSVVFSITIYFSFPPINRLKTLMLVFLFGGLLVYIFLPSKESLILLAFGIFMCFLQHRKVSLLVLSILLMAIARPEAVIILCLSYLIYICRRPSYLLISVTVFLYLYFGFGLRELLFEVAISHQAMAILYSDTFKCQYGFLNVCLATIDGFELTIINRLLLIGSLPLKWCYDFWMYCVGGTYSGVVFFLKLSQLLPSLYFIFKWKVLLLFIQRDEFRLLLIFVSLYIGTYMSLIFSQPSRPLSTVITLVLLTFFFVKTDSFVKWHKSQIRLG